MPKSAHQKTVPVQARARETYEQLLASAQEILAECGFEALNSNIVCQRAKLTPPAFYRYFSDKYDILAVLGDRLMDVQNAVLEAGDKDIPFTRESFIERSVADQHATIAVTKEFMGAYPLLVSMRAIPELRPVRINSHDKMSAIVAAQLYAQGAQGGLSDLQAKCRLGIEMGYASLEMLFETDFENQDMVILGTANALFGIIDMADPSK